MRDDSDKYLSLKVIAIMIIFIVSIIIVMNGECEAAPPAMDTLMIEKTTFGIEEYRLYKMDKHRHWYHVHDHTILDLFHDSGLKMKSNFIFITIQKGKIIKSHGFKP